MASARMKQLQVIAANVLGSYKVSPTYRSKFADAVVYHSLKAAFNAGLSQKTSADNPLSYYLGKKLYAVGIGSSAQRTEIARKMAALMYAAQPAWWSDDETGFWAAVKKSDVGKAVSDAGDWVADGLTSEGLERTKDRIWEVCEAYASCVWDRTDLVTLGVAIAADAATGFTNGGAATIGYLKPIVTDCAGGDSPRVLCKLQAIFDGRYCDKNPPAKPAQPSPPAKPAPTPSTPSQADGRPTRDQAAYDAWLESQRGPRPSAAGGAQKTRTAGWGTWAGVALGLLTIAGVSIALANTRAR